MFLLGYDIGSSSIKASLMEAASGRVIASAVSPKTEMAIVAERPGWAEQHPHVWWDQVKSATAEIKEKKGKVFPEVQAIGISYQMHGLVLVDRNQKVLRPSIIWCDSRAVGIGEQAFSILGPQKCLNRLLNSPGNFTASKLKWVMEHEPEIFAQAHKFILPGDYIAMKMTGEVQTTASGLSEGIFWDFAAGAISKMILDFYGIPANLIPQVVETFSVQAELNRNAAAELGLKPGTKVSYRAGDQPNNALSLNVLNPGEMAATGGTSGVVYGVTEQTTFDPKSRVNIFIHVNHTPDHPRYGVLVCINGTGILNRWLKNQFWASSSGNAYEEMNVLAGQVPPGSEGLMILPYGNGAERTLENMDLGASLHGLQLNIHNHSHLARAAQEGIVFALNYGVSIVREMGLSVDTVRAGFSNLFLSPVFAEIFSAVIGARVELVQTDGSQGAARGGGIGAGIYKSTQDAFAGLTTVRTIEPDPKLSQMYREIYPKWVGVLERELDVTKRINRQGRNSKKP
jgi:xylulokinase